MAIAEPHQPATRSTVTLPEMYRRAIGFYQSGQLDRAEEACLAILSVSPEQPETLVLLSGLEVRRGRLTVAETMLQAAIAVVPDATEIRRNLETLRTVRQNASADPYVRNFLADRRKFMDHPKNVAIETTGRCNGRCTFCPHSELDRRNTEMPDELFDKILSDLEAIPTGGRRTLYTNVVNEPFLDRRIFDRLAAVNARLPGWNIYIHSNFNALPQQFFDRIRRIRNVAGLSVSLNAANEGEYRQTMGLDFRRTVRNIEEFLEEHRSRPFLSGPLVLTRIMDSTPKDREYVEECKRLFGRFHYDAEYVAVLKRRANWLGQTQAKQTGLPSSFPCNQWLNLSILCNGVVPHCCMDAQAEHAIGDVRENSVLEIYNSQPFRNLRERLTARECAYPCNTCGLM